MERQKRVLAVHDISGVGRCSLTVALPIISAAGVECSVLPTAVLSTHTGGFTGYTCRDLTDDLLPMARHWSSLGERFDAIYMGYLGSFAQMDMMREVFSILAEKDTLIAVDPVMGDNGKLYAAFDMTFPPAMRALCAHADLIKPNNEELAALTGCSPDDRRELARAAEGLGIPTVITTRAGEDPLLTDERGTIFFAQEKRPVVRLKGAGDTFLGAFVYARYVWGDDDIAMEFASIIAGDYVAGE